MMRTIGKLSGIVFFSASLLGLPVQVFAAEEPSADSFASFELVNQRRVGRTVFEFTYRASITGGNQDAVDVSATITSTSSATMIVDGAVHFGDVAAGQNVQSSDTFSFRHNRRTSFDPSTLAFDIAFTEVGEEEPGPLEFIFNPLQSVSAEINEDGGSVSLEAPLGAAFIFNAPVASVSAPTQITLTPVTLVENLPAGLTPIAAVKLEPSGTDFVAQPTLTIDPRDLPAPEGPVIAFLSSDDGEEFSYVSPFAEQVFDAVLSDGPFQFVVPHFTVAGIAAVDPGAPLPPSLGALTAQERSTQALTAIEVMFADEASEAGFDLGNLIPLIDPIISDWFNNPLDGILTRLAAVDETDPDGLTTIIDLLNEAFAAVGNTANFTAGDPASLPLFGGDFSAFLANEFLPPLWAAFDVRLQQCDNNPSGVTTELQEVREEFLDLAFGGRLDALAAGAGGVFGYCPFSLTLTPGMPVYFTPVGEDLVLQIDGTFANGMPLNQTLLERLIEIELPELIFSADTIEFLPDGQVRMGTPGVVPQVATLESDGVLRISAANLGFFPIDIAELSVGALVSAPISGQYDIAVTVDVTGCADPEDNAFDATGIGTASLMASVTAGRAGDNSSNFVEFNMAGAGVGNLLTGINFGFRLTEFSLPAFTGTPTSGTIQFEFTEVEDGEVFVDPGSVTLNSGDGSVSINQNGDVEIFLVFSGRSAECSNVDGFARFTR